MRFYKVLAFHRVTVMSSWNWKMRLLRKSLLSQLPSLLHPVQEAGGGRGLVLLQLQSLGAPEEVRVLRQAAVQRRFSDCLNTSYFRAKWAKDSSKVVGSGVICLTSCQLTQAGLVMYFSATSKHEKGWHWIKTLYSAIEARQLGGAWRL